MKCWFSEVRVVNREERRKGAVTVTKRLSSQMYITFELNIITILLIDLLLSTKLLKLTIYIL
jgi:hypothetical protein